MTTSSNSDAELLTEHFGYPPVSLLDDIINSINILAERALNSVEQGLLNLPPASLGFKPPAKTSQQQQDGGHPPHHPPGQTPEERARTEIESGTHQLETLLCASIDRNFDKLELYALRNILTVRPDARDWIRLGHYEGLSFDGDGDGDGDGNSQGGGRGETGGGAAKPSVESVARLRRRLQASQRLGAMLHEERARNAALLAELRALVGRPPAPAVKKDGVHVKVEDADASTGGGGAGAGAGGKKDVAPLAFLGARGDLASADANTPLATTSAFALSQLQALRALSTSLRALAPDLGEVDDDDDVAGGAEDDEGGGGQKKYRKGWRRERLEYVEASTRRHLENVRGLELGRSGEVRDGEWQGEGRNLGTGEVEGLETVVTILGSGARAGQDSASGPEERDDDEMDTS